MSNQQISNALLLSLTGATRAIVLRPELIDLMGSTDGAVFLSQLLYWSDKGGSKDGWFYKPYAEWTDETRLSAHLVKKFAEQCVEMGFLEREVRRVASQAGATVVHYRVDMNAYCECLLASFKNGNLSRLSVGTEPGEVPGLNLVQSVYKEHRLLTENTTENNIAVSKPPPPNGKDILSAYVEELGYNPASFAREGKEAKLLAKDGYAPADVVAAYRILKAQDFWASKHVSLSIVRREIAALANYVKDGGDPGSKGKRMGGAEQAQVEGSKLQKRLREAGLDNLL